MGNEFSGANAIWVQTEKQNYFEGDMVNGTIYLNAISPFQCRGLFIEVHGEERTHWTETETYTEGDQTRTRTIQHHGHREFFNVRVQVYNFGGGVQPGQYAFPFSFHLPAGLPGVFEAQHGDARASIRYRITSECDVKGFWNTDIKHTQFMVVRQRLMKPIMAAKLECHQKITKCCCINKGNADLKVHLDKDSYAPGETCQIMCEIVNNSEESLSQVKVQLMRKIELKSNGYKRHYISDVVARNDYSGLGPNESRTGQGALILPLALNMPGQSPSVQSQLINCEYYVDVEFKTDSVFMSNLDVKVPATIYAPQPPPENFYQQLPPGFQPQMMGAFNVSIPQGAIPPPQQQQGYAPQQQYAPQQNQPQYGAPQPQYGNEKQPLMQQQQPQYN